MNRKMVGDKLFFGAMAGIPIRVLAYLLLAISLVRCTYAGDIPNDPRLGTRKPLKASSSSGIGAPKASDILFVTDSSSKEKGDLGRYLGKGTIKIPLKIDRYFGDKKKLIKSKAIPEKVAVEFVTYDVDQDDPYAPEVDYMYFNGHKIGQLRGSDDNYHRMLFLVDMDYVNLPSAPGAPAQNTITVQVDVNDGGWLTSIEWISIYIPAAPPVILAHGINSAGSDLANLGEKIQGKTGLPCHAFDFPNSGNNHISDYSALSDAISTMKDTWKVEHVNIVAHSMGGLRARGYTMNAKDVLRVLQIATPNRGSPIADFVIEWKDYVEKELAEDKKHGLIDDYGYKMYIERAKDSIRKFATKLVPDMTLDPWRDPAIVCLQTSEMEKWNGLHPLNKEVEYGVVAGKVTKYTGSLSLGVGTYFLFGKNNDMRQRIKKFVDDYTLMAGLGAGTLQYSQQFLSENLEGLFWDIFTTDTDLVVPVSSAHHIVSPVSGSPLTGTDGEVSHSGLVKTGALWGLFTDGASRVVDLLEPKLVIQKTNGGKGDGTSGRSATKAGGRVKSAFAAEGDEEPVVGETSSGIVSDGELVSSTFGIVEGHHALAMLNIQSSELKSTDFCLRSPSGAVYTECAENVLISNAIDNVVVFLAHPEKGGWTFEFAPRFRSPSDSALWIVNVYEVDDGVAFCPRINRERVAVGGSFDVSVRPMAGGKMLDGNVYVSARRPDGSFEEYSLKNVEAGEYSASIPADLAGGYSFFFKIEASDPTRFTRSATLHGWAFEDGASFRSDSITSSGVDGDGNGLYDSLAVSLNVNIVKAGVYRVLATLSDVKGHEVAEGWSDDVECAAGNRRVTVSFDGREIYGNGECGGYVVSSAKLIEVGEGFEAVVDERENLFTTTDYSYKQFEHSLVGMSPGGSDEAVDSDGDGVYDKLNITIPVYADDLVAGNYNWSASLFDSDGNTLDIDSGSVSFRKGDGGGSVMLSFDGSEIAKTDLDGPFYVKSFIIWNYNASFSLPGEYATKPYSIKQWGGTPRHKPRYDFAGKNVSAAEGASVVVRVAGGDESGPCSAQLYLTFNTAAAADVDLAKGKVDGVTPKGGLKFPLKISWAAGETGEKVVEIPIIADAAFEGEEFFTLQLADPVGMQLGEYRDCTVTIQDRNTKATLADGIGNQSLKPATSGAGKWYAVESWMAEPAETERTMFVQSPDMPAGKTASLSFGTVKGAGKLAFDMKFIGELGDGASYVEVYDGKKKLGTLRWTDNDKVWEDWYVTVSETGSHNISIVLMQGADKDSHVRITNVIWKPSSTSSYSTINISTSPEGAGVVGGAGTYANGTKISFNATPRPGYTFVGWYRANGNLFGAKAKMSVNITGSADFIALFRKDPYVRGLADPASAGKVSGSGPCASGKKVTLKATANKGYVFEGWYDERDLRLTQAASLMVDNSAKPAKPSAAVYVVSNIVSDVTYHARFVTVAEDTASISCTAGGRSFPEGDAPVINVTAPCGVYVDWPILTVGLSQTSAKVAGLPAGLKFNAKTGAIEGAPSAPSKIDSRTGKAVPSAVKITVTTAGKSSKTFQVNLTVAAMPDAAVGTFNGFVSPYDEEGGVLDRKRSVASFSLTTTSSGKVSAKAVSPKGSVSFSANYWDELDEGQYSLLARARTGEVLLLYVDGEPEYWNGDYHAYGVVTGGSYGSDYWYVEAQRSSFQKSGKDYEHPEAIDLAKAMQGTFKFNATYNGNGEYKLVQSADKSATLSVAVKNTGAVAVSGTIPGTSYKASCSGMLRVYPLNSEATILACGASGKTVSIMIVLDAVLDENGNVLMTGFANVNPMQ